MIRKQLLQAMWVLILANAGSAHAGLFDWLKKAGDAVSTQSAQPAAAAAASGLGQQEIVDGLKQALSVGADRAIAEISRPGGFASDSLIRIAVPEQMQTLASGLRKLGQGAMVDQFEASMNTAAENAVNEALPVFSDSIRNMSIEDAVGILNGPDNAATEYFRNTTSAALTERIAPLVENAMQQSQVKQYYDTLVSTARGMDRFGLLGLVVPEGADDIDGYVTGKTLDGAFAKLALEEQKIRDNPTARSTELLKKVFGSR